MKLPTTGEWADIFYVDSHGNMPYRRHDVLVKSASGGTIRVLHSSDFEIAFKSAQALNDAYRYGIMVGKESAKK